MTPSKQTIQVENNPKTLTIINNPPEELLLPSKIPKQKVRILHHLEEKY